MHFKPWGPLEWLLGGLGLARPVVVGCLSAEERSVSVPLQLHAERVTRTWMLRVEDEPSKYSEQIEERVEQHRKLLNTAKPEYSETTMLLAPHEQIVRAFETALDGTGSTVDLVLDISCLPKRYFFLMVKLGVREARIRNLIVAYAQPNPAGYTYADLAEDPEPVRAIPGYGPVYEQSKTLVVAVGFEALGLRTLIDDYRDETRTIGVLIPFPPGQPYSRRIWRVLQDVDVGSGQSTVYRVNALDAFGSLLQIEKFVPTTGKDHPPTLAPYGPKPMSLGMCMYALKHDAQVLYTQPRVYHPNYTEGRGRTWGYCVKRDGKRTF